MRQPRLAHEKRKLRVVAKQTLYSKGICTCLLEFAFLPNSKQTCANKGQNKKYPLRLYNIKYVWQSYYIILQNQMQGF